MKNLYQRAINLINQSKTSENGFSMIELLIVVVILGLIAAFAIPQLTGSRRAIQAAELPKQIVAQLRFARQEAMSRRCAFTFEYNNDVKTVRIISHAGDVTAGAIVAGKELIQNGHQTRNNFLNSGQVVKTIQLGGDGFAANDLMYSKLESPETLEDGAKLIPVANRRVTITFQPDGSVIDEKGLPIDGALFFNNIKDPEGTASAVSILGGGGRIKMWRYNRNASPKAYQD